MEYMAHSNPPDILVVMAGGHDDSSVIAGDHAEFPHVFLQTLSEIYAQKRTMKILLTTPQNRANMLKKNVSAGSCS